MNNDKGKRLGNIFTILTLGVIISFCVYGLFFYRAADGNVVTSYQNEEDYSVYSGRNAYEYWRTTLNEEQQILYDEIKESYLQFKEEFSTSVKEISTSDFTKVYKAVFRDHPEIFWMKSYQAVKKLDQNINTSKKIRLVYAYSEDEAREIKSRIEGNYQKIIDEAQTLSNDFKKIKFVHDELIRTSKYTEYTKDERDEYQSIVSIFDSGNTVCAGYSYGFKFIMDNLGIDSVVIGDYNNDNESENHVWNMVKLYDAWYNIDVTWDGTSEDGKIEYKFFLKNNGEFYTSMHKMPNNIPQNQGKK